VGSPPSEPVRAEVKDELGFGGWRRGRQRFRLEEIIAKLREADVLLKQGKKVSEVIKALGGQRDDRRPLAAGARRDVGETGAPTAAAGARARAASAGGGGPHVGPADPAGSFEGSRRPAPAKLISPARRRAAGGRVIAVLGVSERQACWVLGQPRSAPRYAASRRADADALTAAIVARASTYGRYGYHRATAPGRLEGQRQAGRTDLATAGG